jgi:hypothetical protein
LEVPTKTLLRNLERRDTTGKPEGKKGLLERGSAGLRVEKDSERIHRRYRL